MNNAYSMLSEDECRQIINDLFLSWHLQDTMQHGGKLWAPLEPWAVGMFKDAMQRAEKINNDQPDPSPETTSGELRMFNVFVILKHDVGSLYPVKYPMRKANGAPYVASMTNDGYQYLWAFSPDEVGRVVAAAYAQSSNVARVEVLPAERD